MSDTKEKILNQAEILFADRGFDAVSVRDIVAAADVNIAAINYHFGSKSELVFAVLERRITEVNNKRLDLLKQFKNEKEELSLRDVLIAFLQPAFELGKIDHQHGHKFMRIMGRVNSDIDPELKQKTYNLFSEIAQVFVMEMSKALPNVAPEKVAKRFYFSVGSMAHTLMNMVVPEGFETKLGSTDPDAMLPELIDFLEAGLARND